MEIQKEIERIDWLKEVLDHRFLLIRGESGVGKSQLAYFLGETRQTLLNHQLKIINCRIDSLENWNPKSTEATTWIVDEVDIDLLRSEAMYTPFIHPTRNPMDSFILAGQLPANSKPPRISPVKPYNKFMVINLQKNLNGERLSLVGIINQNRVIQLESWMRPTVISEA